MDPEDRLRHFLEERTSDRSSRKKCIRELAGLYPEALVLGGDHGALVMRDVPLAYALSLKPLPKRNIIECLVPPIYQSPLFFALEHCPLQHVVVALLQLYPTSARETNAKGQTPLHIAFRTAAALYKQEDRDTLTKGSECHIVLSLLYKRNPSASLVVDRNGDLPVHIACRYHNSEALIRVAARDCCRAWLVPNEQGELPLHVMLKHHDQQHALDDRLQVHEKRFPESFLACTRSGDLPIHLLLKVLVDEEGRWRDLEDYVCLKDLVQSFVPKLCPVNNDGDFYRDRNGNTPLHLACCYFPIPGVVSACSRWAGHTNNKGEFPLHVLCRALSDPASIFRVPSPGAWYWNWPRRPRQRLGMAKELLLSHPEAVMRVCNRGQLPLHNLCLGGCMEDPDVVRLLLEMYPGAIYDLCGFSEPTESTEMEVE